MGEGVEVQRFSFFFTSTMDAGGFSTLRSDPFTPGKETRYPCTGAVWSPGSAWMGMGNVALIGIRSPHCPARNESLYRLSYPGPPVSKLEEMVKDLTHL